MRILLLILIFVPASALAENCRTRMDVARSLLINAGIQSANITVKNLLIQGHDGSSHFIETPAQILDIKRSDDPNFGLFLNLVNDFPLNGDSMDFDYIQTEIQRIPKPTVTLKSGEVCRLE